MTIELEYVLVPSGLLVLLVYHLWLIYAIRHKPRRTVIGLNAENRHQWVHCLMTDPLKHGTMGVQTLRNNLMATTQLATIAITLSSLITALVSSSSSSSNTSNEILGTKLSYSLTHTTSKYFAVLLCFLVAFFCNLQAMRYFAHVSFLVTSPWSNRKTQHVEYVARHLNQASLFWSLGMRAFYISFPLLLWIFGCIPMFVCCIVLTIVLYFLDTTNHFTKDFQDYFPEDDTSSHCDTESLDGSMVTSGSRSSSVRYPLISSSERG